jgi:hypothetical protein
VKGLLLVIYMNIRYVVRVVLEDIIYDKKGGI